MSRLRGVHRARRAIGVRARVQESGDDGREAARSGGDERRLVVELARVKGRVGGEQIARGVRVALPRGEDQGVAG